jgi:Protein of unknown function (DUF664)
MSSSDVAPLSRPRPPESGSERQTLTGVLDFLRATAVNKVAGLSDAEAFRAPTPPSSLTPAGIIKHLSAVERFWFSIDFAAADLPWPWTDDDPHGNFPIREGDTLAQIVSAYIDECERSRQAIKDADMDEPARGPDMAFTLRYALAHMIEETARHCGHLDLLRESIDGATGE